MDSSQHGEAPSWRHDGRNPRDKTTIRPMASRDDLVRGFMGRSDKTRLTQDGRHHHEMRYDWMLVLALSNEDNRSPNKDGSERSVTESEAVELYAKCFRGEDLLELGQSRQKDQLEVEKSAFLEAFRHLPSVSSSSSYNHSHGSSRATWSDTLTLFRNVIITKLYLHCGLEVSYEGDVDNGDTSVLVVSTTVRSLTREADKSGFPTELSRRLTDPESLAPCCPLTFTPLSHYYLLLPVIPDPAVLKAFTEVVETFDNSPPELQQRYNAEVNLYRSIYTLTMTKLKEEQQYNDTCVEYVTGHKEVEHDSGEGLFEYNFGRAYMSRGITDSIVKEYYTRYLRLRAMHGLMLHPRETLRMVNDEFGSDMRMKAPLCRQGCHMHQRTEGGYFGGGTMMPILVNLWSAIGLRSPLPAYRSYEAGMDPKVWRMHPCVITGPTSNVTMKQEEEEVVLHSPWEAVQRLKLVDNMIRRQLDIDNLSASGILTDIFPLDDRSKLYRDHTSTSAPSDIATCWAIPEHMNSVLSKIRLFFIGEGNPSIEAIRDYYGDKVALYFAFLYTLCWWLLPPAGIGIICFIVQQIYWLPTDSATKPWRIVMDSLYAFIIAVWATLFLEAWKRQQTWFTYRWGQLVEAVREPNRPHFKGILRRSPVDYHDDDLFFDPRIRLIRQVVSAGVLAVIAGIMITLTGLVASWRSHWASASPDQGTLITFITGATTSLQMALFSRIGTYLAQRFNEWENYQTKADFNNHLIYKTFVFEFVNRFNVYFYIAFVKASIEGCVEKVELPEGGGSELISVDADSTDRNCLHELTSQLQTILLIEIAKNVIELAKPMIMHKIASYTRERKRNADGNSSKCDGIIMMNSETGQATIPLFVQEALDKPTYGTLEVDGTFSDYSEMVTLYGYMTLFSLAFPLAPLIGVALAALETRVDGFKMFHLVRRPMPANAPNIGSWYGILQLMAWVTVFTNAALLVWTFRVFDQANGYSQLFYFVILCLGMITLKMVLVIMVPDVPDSVKIANKHNAFIAQRVYISDGDVPRTLRSVDELVYTSINNAGGGPGGAINGLTNRVYRDPCDFGCTISTITKRYMHCR